MRREAWFSREKRTIRELRRMQILDIKKFVVVIPISDRKNRSYPSLSTSEGKKRMVETGAV